MAMNLFGHGIALSSDFVIQGAPKLIADAAGIRVAAICGVDPFELTRRKFKP